MICCKAVEIAVFLWRGKRRGWHVRTIPMNLGLNVAIYYNKRSHYGDVYESSKQMFSSRPLLIKHM